MKTKLKSLIFTCIAVSLLLSTLSFGSTEEIQSKIYTLTYNNQQQSVPLIIRNGELYMNISTLKTFFGFNSKFDGDTIVISDSSQQVDEQIDEHGNIYTGDLVNGNRQGTGTLYLKDGGKYEGQWSNNLYAGTGTLVLPTGDIYVGDFSKGFIHGVGKMFYPDGSYYKGDYTYGVREGFGLYYVNNDNKYSGYWNNGLRNGKGKAYIEGKYKKGLFKNNLFIKNLAESNFDF